MNVLAKLKSQFRRQKQCESCSWLILQGLALSHTLIFAAYLLVMMLLVLWQVAGMQLPERMLRACLWLLCIGELQAATFKLALVGPWSCDPLFSRAMPTAAANLALSRIQSDNSLNRGFSYSIKLLEEDCSVSKGESAYFTADRGSSKYHCKG